MSIFKNLFSKKKEATTSEITSSFRLEDGIFYKSNNHTRFNDGVKSNTDNYGALRGIEIKPTNEHNETYQVSIYILDDFRLTYSDKVQLTPKIMKIIERNPQRIILRGLNSSEFQYPEFHLADADYGIEINLSGANIENIALLLLDRNVKIVYDFIYSFDRI